VSRPRPSGRPVEEPRVRPLYARVLRLRHFAPSATVCFILLEGSVVSALVLALAELVSWWGLIFVPLAVALLVKANDVVAGLVARNADQVPQRERERFLREVRPAIGRATVPVSPTPGWGRHPRAADRPGTVYASTGRLDEPGYSGSDHSGWQSPPSERRLHSPEWRGQPPEWRGQQPAWHEQREWRGQQPEWRGDEPGWRSVQPGRQSAERRYG
jgi:hypothetical protein